MGLEKLMNTTIVSTELTHSRLKFLGSKFGVTEDIVSRLALGISIREGKVPDNWEPKAINGKSQIEIATGKSIRGKTLFKNELPLWVLLLSNVEGQLDSIEAIRSKFIVHWERGIEMIIRADDGEDWVHLISSLVANE